MYSTTCNTSTIMHLKPNCELSSWPVSTHYAYIMPPCNLTVRKGLGSFHPCVQETQGVDHLQRWCAIQTWCRPGRWLHVSCFTTIWKMADAKHPLITTSTWKDFKCFYERTVFVCVCSLLVCYEIAMIGSSSLGFKAPPWSSLMMPGPEAFRQVAHQGITLWVALPTPSQCWHASVGLRWCRAPKPCWTDWWEAYLTPGV